MSRRPGRRLAVVGVVVTLFVTAGCAVTQPGSGRPAAVVLRAQARRPGEVLAAAMVGLGDLFGFETEGTLTLGPTRYTVDLRPGYSTGHGTVTADGTTEVLDLGGPVSVAADPSASGLFITAPAAFWTRVGVDAADAARYDGHQVSIPQSSPLAQLSTLLVVHQLTQLLFTAAGTPESPSLTSSPPVDGQAAWVVDFGGAHTTRMTVQRAGQQFPLRLVSPHATLALNHFGVEPKVTTPSGTPLSLPG